MINKNTNNQAKQKKPEISVVFKVATNAIEENFLGVELWQREEDCLNRGIQICSPIAKNAMHFNNQQSSQFGWRFYFSPMMKLDQYTNLIKLIIQNSIVYGGV